MQLKKPLTLDSEAQYLTHCNNIARILAHVEDGLPATQRINKYVEITGAQLVKEKEKDPNEKFRQQCRDGVNIAVEKKFCPKCCTEVEFAQNPLRICDKCGWTGDYTKLRETN